MNITATPRIITEYHCTFSAEDLQRYLANPKAFRAEVLAQLNGSTPTKAPVKPKKHSRAARGSIAKLKTPIPKLARTHRGEKPTQERKPIDRVPCENCGVMIAAYRQGRHKCRSASSSAAAAA